MRTLIAALITTLALVAVPAAASADKILLDATITGDSELVAGTRASIYVSASESLGLRHSRPARARASARLVTLDEDGKPATTVARLAAVKTDAKGRAVISFEVPAPPDKPAALLVEVRSPLGSRDKLMPVAIRHKTVLHARTDRGIYRPGSTLRWRVSAIHRVDAHPLAGLGLDVAIVDPNDTAIWRGTVTTDAGGMVAGEVPLSADIRRGGYKVVASAPKRGAATAEAFRVADVKLPPFAVSITGVDGDLAPGKTVRARVQARYLHGEPVRGKVEIRASVDNLELVERETSLDRFGAATLSFVAPLGRRGVVTATVVDGAGRRRGETLRFDLPGADLNLAIVPESEMTAGEQRVTVITTNDRGELVPATVRLWWPGATSKRVIKSPGAAVATIDLRRTPRWFQLQASAVSTDGRVAEASRSVSLSNETQLVRVASPLLRPNQTVAVTGRWPGRRAPVIATLLRRGVPVAAAPAEVDRRGRLQATLVPPPGLFGLATVRVYELPYHPQTGKLEPRVATRSVYIQPGDLDVAIEARLRHKPGSRATVGVTVSDRRGKPVPGVHLAASVVDERILALSEPRPDLVAVLRDLDDVDSSVEYTARRAGLAFASLLERSSDAAHMLALSALLDSLPAPAVRPAHVLVTEAERVAAEHVRAVKARAAVKKLMLASAASFGARDRLGRWGFAGDLDAVLATAGWKPAERTTPWERPIRWVYAAELDPTFRFDTMAHEVIDHRLDLLERKLRERRRLYERLAKRGVKLAELLRRSRLPEHLGIDPWGAPIALEKLERGWIIRSAGPDQKHGTDDDLSRGAVFSLQGIGTGGGGMGYGSGRGTLRGRTARAPTVRIGNAQVDVKVRKRFDETVLWVTGVTTDASGKASFAVDLADSITGWQIDVEAIGPRGQIGAGQSRLETFLPRYADPAVPGSLTSGDRYTVPVILANHTAAATTMRVDVTASGAITLRDRRSRSDKIPANATRALGFAIQASGVGAGTLRVDLFAGGQKVDAIERTIEVLPPGRLSRSTGAASLESGKGALALTLPASVASGTSAATVRVFRHAGDRALDGIDRLVREPHGCFEQTSSATYPNLLVVKLLGNREGTEDVVARARDFVAKGYQRLISYEVSGGGFSWFGESPANQVLTAYGLMEFVDMAEIYPVDPGLIDRTRKWLLGKQRGDGSWLPDKSWLHDWDAAQGRLATTAYVSWALAESGYRGARLRKALGYLGARRAQLARQPYLLSLWAAAESKFTGRAGAATRALASQLRSRGDQAFVSARGATLFYARGRAADAQVTALATMALHRAKMVDRADKTLRFVLDGGGAAAWGGTQGTVLALRAAVVTSPVPAPFTGKLAVRVNGRDAGAIDLAASGALGLEIDRHLRAGVTNRIELRPGTAAMPERLGVSLDARWRTAGPAPAETQGIAVKLEPSRTAVDRGERIAMKLTLSNPGADKVVMPTAVIPVPPGFRFVAGSTAGVAKVEDVGSEVRIYLHQLAPKSSAQLSYHLEAEATCRVTQRGAEAYAYYSPEIRGASAPLLLTGR